MKQLTTTGAARVPFCAPNSQEAYFSVRDDKDEQGVSLWSVPLAGGPARKIFAASAFGSFLLDRDAKFAELTTVEHLNTFYEILNLESHTMVHKLPANVSSADGGFPAFSPDGKAIVAGATTKTGNTLLSQPIDGSAPRSLINPTHDTIVDFAWSPSGNKLGVLQFRKSSDVVLITEQDGKGAAGSR